MIPTFQDLMLPILEFANSGGELTPRSVVETMEDHFHLTDEDRRQRNLSGQLTIYNRVMWAITHLKKADLLESRVRGTYKLTESGRALLAGNPPNVNIKLLRTYPKYIDWNNSFGRSDTQHGTSLLNLRTDAEGTPEEAIGLLSEELDAQLAIEILDAVCENSPSFFEGLVVDLLLKMGYGGLQGSGEVTKATGDGGIDGIVTEDELGFERIYVQAKKWDKGSSVSRSDIQKFAGALLGEGAVKGVFITTGGFSRSASEYARLVPNATIVLIDGLTLTKLMIKYELGVSTTNTIQIKKLDSDYYD